MNVDKRRINDFLEKELIPFLVASSLSKEDVLFVVSAIMVALD